LKTETEIDDLDRATIAKKAELNARLKAFESDVKAAFGLSVDTLFNCLSQLSFVNVGEPARAAADLL
jgi:hypothetical protein